MRSSLPQRAHLTPRMASLLALIARAGRPPLHTMTPEQARHSYGLAAEVLDLPRAPLPRVQDVMVPTSAAVRCPGRLYVPDDEAGLPVCLYFHGGGFVIGGLETHDSLCRQIALRSRMAVLALDYRLAPEHPFPAAVDDAWGALQWLQRQGAAQLGLDAARIAVAGDSAGGTLAAVCALMARDAGLPLAAQVLITPGMSAWQQEVSHQLYGEGHLLDTATVQWFFNHYVQPAQREDWRFSPLMADDVGDTAPACVVLAECDPLVDEGMMYADRLRMAGVPVALELARGVTHDFIKMGRTLPEAEQALQAVAEFLLENTPAAYT